MCRYPAFAAALVASFIAVNLAGCGTKGPLTLPQKPQALAGAAAPVARTDLNTADGRGR
ncbi:MAG: lipoprotein [Betaproteobacteria bacterium]|nr:lipoprotein [Betaproteobacteria bacterium]